MLLILLSLIIPSVLGVAAGWAAGRNALPLPSVRRLMWVVTPLLVAGVWLTVKNAQRIEQGLARTKWPTVVGVVIGSKVVTYGPKNYRPDISYRYEVAGAVYHSSSYYGVPGFGMISSRREVAESLVAAHPLGSEVKVFYNPVNFHESWLRPGPLWDSYGQYGLGMLLLGVPLLLVASRTIGRDDGKAAPAKSATPDAAPLKR